MKPVTITKFDGGWVVTKGAKRLVQSMVDSNFRWKYQNRITIDDAVVFDTHQLKDILDEFECGAWPWT